MGSNFIQQFMAGWQMGQGRQESLRRNQELQMEQQRQAQMLQMAQQRAQREVEDHEINVKAQKIALEKAKLDAQMAARTAAETFAAQQGMDQLQASAAPGGQFTRPGAAPIPGMQELAGPPAEGTPTQPAIAQIPGIDAGGVNVPARSVGGIEILKQLLDEQRRARAIKAEDAAEMERAKLEAAEPFKEKADARTAARQLAAARARGKELAGVLGAFGTATTEGQKNKVEVAQYGIRMMPSWQKFVTDNKDKFGFWAGKKTKVVQSGALEPLGVEPDTETAKFTSSLSVMTNALLNALSGAAISPQEYERMKQQIPLLEDPPSVAAEKMKTLDDYFKFRLKNFNAPYEGPGWEERPSAPGQSAAPNVNPAALIGTFYGAEVYAEE